MARKQKENIIDWKDKYLNQAQNLLEKKVQGSYFYSEIAIFAIYLMLKENHAKTKENKKKIL